MNHYFSLKRLISVLLLIIPILEATAPAAEVIKPSATASTEKSAINANEKPGYAIDGRTSASVLAAKRSHQVSKDDEIGLTVFSGLIVIAVIGFFSQKLFEK